MYGFVSNSEELIDIIIHNPHSFGNENAIDEMPDTMEIYFGIDFDKRILESGKPEFHGEYMTQYSREEDTCAML